METSTAPVTSTAVGLRYGLYTGLILIVLTTVLSVAEMESASRWASTIILIGGIFLAHKYFKQQNYGFMGYAQGLGIGTLLSAVAGLLNGIFSYIYLNYIDPAAAQKIMDKAQSDMDARGGMSDAQMEQALGWTKMFVTGPLLIVFVLFIIVLTGFVLSLLISIFTKNSRPEFE